MDELLQVIPKEENILVGGDFHGYIWKKENGYDKEFMGDMILGRGMLLGKLLLSFLKVSCTP